MMNKPSPSERQALDLVWGAENIAEVIGRTRRSVFHLLERGELPARKVGGRWVISRRALQAHFEQVGDGQ